MEFGSRSFESKLLHLRATVVYIYILVELDALARSSGQRAFKFDHFQGSSLASRSDGNDRQI